MACLVMPCAGIGSRLRMPYPKAVLKADAKSLLIDYGLAVGRLADVKKTYLVVNPQSRKAMIELVGGKRDGMPLTYVDLLPDDPAAEMASIIRGCRRAQLSGGFQKFIIAWPDRVIPKSGWEEAASWLTLDGPVVVTSGDMPAFISIGVKELSKLRRAMTSATSTELRANGFVDEVLLKEMEKGDWETFELKPSAGMINVDEWSDYRKLVANEGGFF